MEPVFLYAFKVLLSGICMYCILKFDNIITIQK